MRSISHFGESLRWIATVVIGCVVAAPAQADDRITLRDGFTMTGRVELDENRVIVRAGPRSYVFAARRLLKHDPDVPLPPIVSYRFKQPAPRNAPPLGAMTALRGATPFDAFGRRTVTIGDERRRDVAIHQAIAELYPTHAVLEGLTRPWTSSISLSQVPFEQWKPILDKATKPSSPQDRLKLAQFLTQAGRYEEAKAELEKIQKEFPDVASQTQEQVEALQRAVAERGLEGLDQALKASQLARAHQWVEALRDPPVPPTLEARYRKSMDELSAIEKQIESARATLTSSWQSTMSLEPREPFEQAMAEILAGVSPGTLARLEPALRLATQPTTSPRDVVALAVSGWALGAELAQKEPAAAVTAWRQRAALESAVQSESDVAFVGRLEDLEKLQATPDVAARLLEFLPAPETTIAPAKPTVVKWTGPNGPGAPYAVVLPPDYDRHSQRPAIVALVNLGQTTEEAASDWTPRAGERGYVVVAIDWRNSPDRAYEYSVAEHERVLAALADARRRFAIDADRVFVTGYQIGGFAAWDVGMSHPDEFAGLLPISAAPRFYCDRYVSNLEHLPIFAIVGELNAGSATLAQLQFSKYFQKGYDAVYVEYPGRGAESFVTEIPTALDWMEFKRRNPYPEAFEATSARLCDRRFYWVEATSFLKDATAPPELFDRRSVRPARIEAVSQANNHALAVSSSGLSGWTALLAPKLMNFSDPQFTIKWNGRRVHHGAVALSLDTLVREVRATGDRKRLVFARIEIE